MSTFVFQDVESNENRADIEDVEKDNVQELAQEESKISSNGRSLRSI